MQKGLETGLKDAHTLVLRAEWTDTYTVAKARESLRKGDTVPKEDALKIIKGLEDRDRLYAAASFAELAKIPGEAERIYFEMANELKGEGKHIAAARLAIRQNLDKDRICDLLVDAIGESIIKRKPLVGARLAVDAGQPEIAKGLYYSIYDEHFTNGRYELAAKLTNEVGGMDGERKAAYAKISERLESQGWLAKAAICAKAAENTPRAQELCARVVSYLERNIGPDYHPSVSYSNIYERIADYAASAGLIEKVKEMYGKAADAYRRSNIPEEAERVEAESKKLDSQDAVKCDPSYRFNSLRVKPDKVKLRR